jgi:Sec-independent protein translocase protein TatA
MNRLRLLLCLALCSISSAFLSHKAGAVRCLNEGSKSQTIPSQGQLASTPLLPLLRQRRSFGVVQTRGLFGLGGPEIIIILVGVAFVLGPEKLIALGKDAGKAAGDISKEVPKEFQKGFDEGEVNARSRTAKPMEKRKPKEKEKEESKND